MRVLILVFVCLGICINGAEAQLKSLTIDDTNDSKLRPKQPGEYGWIPKKDAYFYFEKDKMAWQIFDLPSKKEHLLFVDSMINDLKRGGLDTFSSTPSLTWISMDTVQFKVNNKIYAYNINKRAVQEVNQWEPEAENMEFSKMNDLAYTKSGNIYLKLRDSKTAQVLTDGDGYQVVFGEAVHRNEFGINKGLFWNDNGDKLAFYRMDQSQVADYPLIDYKPVPAIVKNIKYPMAGQTSHFVTIGIYDIKMGSIVYLNTGLPADQYLTNIAWDPSGEYIYVAVINRDQNHVKLNKYSSVDGSFKKTIFEEKNGKYVQPMHPLTFLQNSRSKFIWMSQRSGYDHLYLYDTSGRLERQLTRGDWSVDQYTLSADGKYLYYQSNQESPLASMPFQLDFKTYTTSKLVSESGWHRASISSSGNYMLDHFQSAKQPGVLELVDLKKNKLLKNLFQASNPLAEFNIPSIEITTLKAVDGKTDLYIRTIKPKDFDPNKKYPLLNYVYGGPSVQLIQDRYLYGADMFLMYMASQGFVVTTIDTRGSARRGFDFESSTFRELGKLECQDVASLMSLMKSLPYIDTTKMACFGWSFGGFMTTSLMTKYPDLFKVGVAGGPVMDWALYEVMYTERYMDTPKENPLGYNKSKLVDKSESLKGRLLILQGLQDDVVLPQNADLFLNDGVKKRKLIDFYPYSAHPHNVRGRDRTQMYQKIEDYIKTHLGI